MNATNANMKNVTFAVSESMLGEIRQVVQKGWKPSMNSVVREALEKYLQEIKQEQIRLDMLEASNDPLFLADVKECSRAFRSVDQESSAEW